MRRISLLCATALVPCLAAADNGGATYDMGQIVVTSPMASDPLTVETDPKAPRQPIPASDGASYLENIPGFTVSRKGGTDGDAALRGLGGSRLNILLDDAYILGGCGQRMDPPTAYVYPESYDKVVVLKGPQSVRYGASVAGTVRFDRETERFDSPGVRGTGSLVFGGFGRNDQMFDVATGNSTGYVRAIGTRSDSDNYEDGEGEEVHSFYTRWSGTAIAGWTPDDDTRVELTYDVSDGEAAYADRMMDGVEFDREGYSLAYEKTGISPLVERLEAKAYYNYVDHVMDNFSLRDPGMSEMLKNPDRETTGFRTEVQLGLGADTFAVAGVDYQTNKHTFRGDLTVPRNDKAEFATTGLFGDVTHSLSLHNRLLAGLRIDQVEAEALQTKMGTYGGVAAGTTDDDTNTSGFVRYEHDLNKASMVYAGIGQAVRSPDFWERSRVFDLDNEKNTQLDVGWGRHRGRLQSNVALFYSGLSDYILITYDNDDATPDAKNIDAITYGAEAEAAYVLTRDWTLRGSLAYVHGTNDTDGKPLAQMPPLEATLGADFKRGPYSAGLLVRGVDRQDRVDVGSGSIFGSDVGETPGFAVVSVNGGYRVTKDVLLTAGVDNLLDKTYAEHVGAGSPDLMGQRALVNEPGRTLWLKASATF